jgi:anaerobic selenocysteine-containing dehydrogenase
MAPPPNPATAPKQPQSVTINLTGRPGIDTDGSPTVFNPTTKAGRQQIEDSGPTGFLETDAKDPKGQDFTFKTGKNKGHTHRFVMGDNGSFVSPTSLQDSKFGLKDQHRYADADKVAYVALSKEDAKKLGVKLGDEVELTNLDNKKTTRAIFADSAGGHTGHIEMSPPAATALGMKVDARGWNNTEHLNLQITSHPPALQPTTQPTTPTQATPGGSGQRAQMPRREFGGTEVAATTPAANTNTKAKAKVVPAEVVELTH